MPVESVTYISDLNPSNPLGTGEPKSFGDDHMRNIKLALKNTFPNITGAATPSHTELNRLTGVTGVEGTGKLVLALAAVLPALSGVNLTALNASNLGSGTVPDARFPATLPAASGANLTALNGTNVATGTVADARLSSNVPLKNAANVFSANQTIELASTAQLLINNSANNSTDQARIVFQANSANRAFVGVGSIITGGTRDDLSLMASTGRILFSGDNGGTVHLALSSSGLVTTPNANAAEVGYKGVPQNVQNSSYTLVLADAGKHVLFGGSPAQKWTIPAEASVNYPLGTVLTFINRETTNSISIAITTDTLVFAGAGTTGTRTLGPRSMASAVKVLSGVWLISGPGLS